MRHINMRRCQGLVLGAAAALAAAAVIQWPIEGNRPLPDEPFRVAGNLYYVGATGLSAFLLTGSEGQLLSAGIARLGFDLAEHRVDDGATIRLGPIALTTRHTVGRLRSCTSWALPVHRGDRELVAVGSCSLALPARTPTPVHPRPAGQPYSLQSRTPAR